ncbi:MAG: helix-turn-helix domain-containing protein [Bacteroidaceae bacterium]|nr:helix-turn-helix domain-containing protein [Bacteroidaceae bacterium]
MKERIRQLMLDKGMTQKSLASELCIAEATLSGIFNGRTRPTNLTVSAIHERFPEVNISWLMFGEGEMYTGAQDVSLNEEQLPNGRGDAYGQADLFSGTDASIGHHDERSNVTASVDKHSYPGATPQGQLPNAAPAMQVPQIQYIEKYLDKPQRKITEIRIFFDDGTYETFTP